MIALALLLAALALLLTPAAAAAFRLRGHAAGQDHPERAQQDHPERAGPAGTAPVRPSRQVRRDVPHPAEPGPLELAAAWDLFAACLRAGLPVPTALHAAADGLAGAPGAALARTAALMAMGADADQAWRPALECAATARLARLARHSGRSGAALADSLRGLATDLRAAAADQSEAAAQRSAVLIAGPLGLCFLPAFLALGVAPVVLGLLAALAPQWAGP